MKKKKWLQFLYCTLNYSQSFYKELDQQLWEQAYNLVGIDVHKFFLFPNKCDNFTVNYTVDNTAYINAYLVEPDNFGYPIQICWRYSAHSKHDTYLK